MLKNIKRGISWRVLERETVGANCSRSARKIPPKFLEFYLLLNCSVTTTRLALAVDNGWNNHCSHLLHLAKEWSLWRPSPKYQDRWYMLENSEGMLEFIALIKIGFGHFWTQVKMFSLRAMSPRPSSTGICNRCINSTCTRSIPHRTSLPPALSTAWSLTTSYAPFKSRFEGRFPGTKGALIKMAVC